MVHDLFPNNPNTSNDLYAEMVALTHSRQPIDPAAPTYEKAAREVFKKWKLELEKAIREAAGRGEWTTSVPFSADIDEGDPSPHDLIRGHITKFPIEFVPVISRLTAAFPGFEVMTTGTGIQVSWHPPSTWKDSYTLQGF
jgi:hypothetical protein